MMSDEKLVKIWIETFSEYALNEALNYIYFNDNHPRGILTPLIENHGRLGKEGSL